MGRSIERIAVGTLVFSVSVLSLVGLMAIWGWINEDALWKSFSTIGVVGVTALVVVGITRVGSMYYKNMPAPTSVPESASWRSARNLLLGVVGVAILFFAALSVLSIWDFVGNDSLTKAFESMGLLFCSAVVLLVAFKSQMEV